MTMDRQRMGLVLVVLLVASGTALLAKGLGLGAATTEVDRQASRALPQASRALPQPDVLPAVRPGSGVYRQDEPTTSY